MSSPEPPRPTEATLLRDYPWVVVRFRCHYCRRAGDARLAVLAARYGPSTMIGELLRVFMGRCAWSSFNLAYKPQKYGMKCGGYMPDLNRVGPPDLPPALLGLRLVEGGKDEMLPSEPARRERRKRRGGADD